MQVEDVYFPTASTFPSLESPFVNYISLSRGISSRHLSVLKVARYFFFFFTASLPDKTDEFLVCTVH